MVAQKLRILCLHGYQQNAALFRSKCGGFRGKTKALAEYFFVEAPNVIDGNAEQRAWTLLTRPDPESPDEDSLADYQKSLDIIGEVVEREGPFDGLMAFSQGCSIAAIMFHSMEQPDSPFKVNPKIKFNFIVCICGCEARRYQFTTPVSIPSLHLIGKTDRIVNPERAKQYAELYSNREVYEYEGGHHVPSSGETSTIIRQFLTKFLTEE